MSAQTHYFKLGLFIIIGSVLVAAAIVILGVGALFQDKIMMETYLDESAQGLAVGSPVKFRGVQIGNIERLGFANNKYKDIQSTEYRYVLVEFALTEKVFGQGGQASFERTLAREVERGLRVRVAPQGLTGTAYLEMNYLDPGRYPPLPLDWTPEYAYVPSAPGAIARLEESFESVSRTLSKLENARIDQIANNLDELLVIARDTLSKARVSEMSEQAVALLAEVRETNRRLSEILGDACALPGAPAATKGGKPARPQPARDNIAKVLADISQASQSVRDLATGLQAVLNGQNGQGALQDFAETMRRLNKASAEIPATLQNIRAASQDLPEAMAGLRSLFSHASDLLQSQQDEIESILRNTERASRNLKEATGDAKRYPAYFLFGEPPAAPKAP